MTVVPANMRIAFQKAGWFEGRQVAVGPGVPTGHPAHAILAELTGVTLIEPAPNVCSVEFKAITQVDPSIAAWGEALGTSMVGIAEEDDGHSELYLTDRGQVIGSSQVHPACFLVGQSFDEAIEAIGRGDQARPLLLPDQEEVTLYGRAFRHGDPEVLGPGDIS
jgi:hypothetical protein